jgi:Ca2+-binding RTX toxin-like protein
MIANPGNNNEHADWSPNGRRIVFDAGAYGSQIYSVRPDGSGLRQLTDPPFMVFDQTPAWSPDGQAIVFSEERQPVGTDLYVIDPNGLGRRLLAQDGWAPSWSPDGSSIVFVRYSRDRQVSDLVIVGADGRGERVLTQQMPGSESSPAWSPDGEWIAFETSGSAGALDVDIAVIRPDGSGFKVVRGSSLLEFAPAWKPRSSKLPGKQRPCAIRGGSRADVLTGTTRGDLILAGDGRDSIRAGGGPDLVDGGPGDDLIMGGPGNDVLNGDSGGDRLLGGSGSDLLYGDDEEGDLLNGNGGSDTALFDSLDRLLSVEHAGQS